MINTNDTMYSYQPVGIKMLLERCKLPLLLPYGSGKSWIVLEAIKHSKSRQVIVLCKKRNIITWTKEITKRLPNVPIYPIVGGSRKRLQTMLDSARSEQFIWLIPYSSLHNVVRQIQWLIDFKIPLVIDWLIADESTTIKNPGAVTTKAALFLSKEYPNARKAILTGNIAPETFKEVWSQLAFVDISRLGTTYYQFLRKWFVLGQFNQWTIDLDKQQRFLDILTQSSFLLTHEEYHQLMKKYPKSRYVIEHYKCTPQQKKLLKNLYRDWELPTSKSMMEQYNYAIILGTKAQQICSGFYYTEGETLTLASPNNKIKLLRSVVSDLLIENKHRKIVIWRKFKEEDSLIHDALQHKYPVLVGPSASNLLCFEHPLARIIVMPVQCSQGYNELVVADTNIFFSNDFSLEKRNQAESRIWRPTQQAKGITHIDLCSSDQRDYEVILALQNKELDKSKLVEIYSR